MSTWDAFYGPNAGYAQELYDRYLENPESVDAATRQFFNDIDQLGNGAAPAPRPSSPNGRTASEGVSSGAAPETGTGKGVSNATVAHIVAAARLARSIREYGHLAANIDPLGASRPGDPMLVPATHDITDADLAALPASIVWPKGSKAQNALEAMRDLRDIYCGPLGYEFDHVQDFGERAWLHDTVESGAFRQPLPPEQQWALLERLTQVEAFERFLHTVFVGQKRFSIEGDDVLVPMLDELIQDASQTGTREIVIGMSHRGRLNVLAHVLGKPYESILSEFHSAQTAPGTSAPEGPGQMQGWTGDVKYHLGARKMLEHDESPVIQITLADNPSHLEVVDPAVEGSARAAQDNREHAGAPTQNVDRALPVTMHGDAAFVGEGVVAETLNLSGLPGYTTGGSVRIIVNNQVGFTTSAEAGRSTLYASDLAKGFEIPIVHVNADEPEACLSAIRLAYAYRQRFHKDFLIDIVGYRRWGHNEGDEPSFTQPLLYGEIGSHRTVRAIYADILAERGTVTPEQAATMLRDAQERLQTAREAVTAGNVPREAPLPEDAVRLTDIKTAVPADELRALNEALLVRPENFTPNPKLERVLKRRREALDRPGGIDWALGEALSLASILADGTPIRLTGQDTERGTFSHRHLVLHDAVTGDEYTPLQHIPQAQASFAVYNSPLTETAVLGFEYGYSVHAQHALVLWEAQFGDFANTAQVIIDQFLTGARAKWRQQPSLALLLPHGYEGQGPEHSSGRLERYLQLAAEDNVRIANATTPAQYFHLLRLQAATLANDPRPLVIMTPKSLLRHPKAASSLDDLSQGHFEPVIDQLLMGDDPDQVRRLVLCSGKVAVDLESAAEKRETREPVALGRVELLYPFPTEELENLIHRFPRLQEVIWAQEEPANMGAWQYMAARLPSLLPQDVCLRYIGRRERASTAEGSPEVHAREQARIVDEALEVREPAGVSGREHAS